MAGSPLFTVAILNPRGRKIEAQSYLLSVGLLIAMSRLSHSRRGILDEDYNSQTFTAFHFKWYLM